MYDLIKCDEFATILEHHASEKYMVLKDFYLTIQ